MRIVSSKIKFEIDLVIMICIVVVLTSIYISLFIYEIFYAEINVSVFSALLFGAIILFSVYYLAIFGNLERYKKVRIFENNLSLSHLMSKEIIYFSEITNIELCGIKQINTLLQTIFQDVIEISTAKRNYYISIDSYSNSKEIQYELIDKLGLNQPIKIKEVTEVIGNLTAINKWKIFQFHFLLINIPVIFITFGICMLIKNFMIFPIIVILTLYLSSTYLNYLQFNDDFFVVRNNLKFWLKKTYKLNDIERIILLRNGQAPTKISVTLKDYTKCTYYISCVGMKNLKMMIDFMNKRGIIIEHNLY
ncbi:MAG: hypothetical protein WCK02_17635 [Bacteroidota bacterium]